MGEEEKLGSVRYINFSGEGNKFKKWKVKTLALARRKGFADYLKTDMLKSGDEDEKFQEGNVDYGISWY